MIYDCFIFFNELDLLDIRLNVLGAVVDKFVLVEASHTFQGNPKPLHYSDNKERFKAFHDKIIHVVVHDLPPKRFSFWKSATASGPFEMEIYQRNHILTGIAQCSPKDVIIISDLDEIPDPEKVREFQNEPGLKVFQQKNFYYYINCVSLSEEWYGSVMGFFEDVYEPQDFRSLSKEMTARNKKILKNQIYRFYRSLAFPPLRKKISLIDNGGWHFGYLGGIDQIIKKIEAFSHDEYNTDEFKNKQDLRDKILSGRDLFGRDLKYTFVEVDDSFPQYILRNKDRLKHLIR